MGGVDPLVSLLRSGEEPALVTPLSRANETKQVVDGSTFVKAKQKRRTCSTLGSTYPPVAESMASGFHEACRRADETKVKTQCYAVR